MTDVPTLAEVERIAAFGDPVIRNLQITQCYHELSAALARRTGSEANWCTFATWASKQAGQSIRKEDLLRALERALEAPVGHDTEVATAETPEAEAVAQQAQQMGAEGSRQEVRVSMRRALRLQLAVDRVAEAVGRGNRKVFAEIGAEFARFLADFSEATVPDAEKLERFLAGLRPGEPPEGQDYLRRAFTRYYGSFFERDAKTRAEMLLCANLEIGLHEQTRLQPEIAEALDAAYINLTVYLRTLMTMTFPFFGLPALTLWLGKRVLGRPTMLEQAARRWLAAVQVQMRHTFTAALMTLRFPPDSLVQLGDDLKAGFPDMLRQIVDADLRGLLERIDPTPDSPVDSGARDWANLPDRLHFIADLFRCYQESPALFEPPFTPEQVREIKAARKPEGPL
jgi:hypothetical protein